MASLLTAMWERQGEHLHLESLATAERLPHPFLESVLDTGFCDTHTAFETLTKQSGLEERVMLPYSLGISLQTSVCDPVCRWEGLCGCQSVHMSGVMYTVFWSGLEGWTWCNHVPRMLMMVSKSAPLMFKVRGLGM